MTLSVEELEKLWLLLLTKPTELTDEEIDRLLENEDKLREFVCHAWSNFPQSVKAVKRYRARKKELSAKSPDELHAILQSISGRRSRVPDEAFYYDDPTDFDSPTSSADEGIIHKLLQERQAASAT